MASFSFPQTSPFDPINGDLRPNYRDAYLHGQLAPTVALQVEQYLKSSPVRTGAALGRYHELAAVAQQRGTTLTAPQWVQQQLLSQPIASPAGPLRRPVVRLALALFGILSVASVVQWIRNEPLIPAPVVAAVSRVATSATEATERLVQRFVAAPAGAEVPASKPSARTAVPRTSLKKPKLAILPVASSNPSVVSGISETLADSLAVAVPGALAAAPTPTNGVAIPTATGTVRGHISDARGRPLVGATVLVKGTAQGVSTDAAGNYELPVTAGATLEYGYAGYNDLQRTAALGTTMNVELQPNGAASPRKSRGAASDNGSRKRPSSTLTSQQE